MRELRGKIAVVTGAASGIGRALAVCLAEQGSDLALVDLDSAGLNETGAQVSALERRVSLHRLDVSDMEAMRALPERVLEEHGRVDLLVNNAGIAAGHSFEDQPIESFEQVIGVNLMGVVYGCKFFLPYLRERPEAHIVNISSVFGFMGVPLNAAYCSSKFAVRGLSEVLWGELSRTKVRVTCVHPGGVRTQIVRNASGFDGAQDDIQARFERVVRRTPERAARSIVRAIHRGKPRLRLGFEAYLMDWIARVFPTVSRRLRLPPGYGRAPEAGADD